VKYVHAHQTPNGARKLDFDASQIGQWSETLDFAVTTEDVIAYARAINDETPDSASGRVAPPVFAVVPGGLIWKEVVQRILIGDPGTASMHGEHDLVIHQPIKPGMILVLRAALWGITPKASGTLVTVKIETADKDGGPVNDQYLTLFFRGVTGLDAAGHPAPDHTAPTRLADEAPAVSITTHVDHDQSLRYAQASRDFSSYHLSDDAARAAGFTRIFIHGLCTMAMAGSAAVKLLCASNPSKLRRLAVRFSSVVYPGQDITTRFWALPSSDSVSAFAFEVVDSHNAIVVKNGRAETAAG
jgi:acyl dehydratase